MARGPLYLTGEATLYRHFVISYFLNPSQKHRTRLQPAHGTVYGISADLTAVFGHDAAPACRKQGQLPDTGGPALLPLGLLLAPMLDPVHRHLPGQVSRLAGPARGFPGLRGRAGLARVRALERGALDRPPPPGQVGHAAQKTSPPSSARRRLMRVPVDPGERAGRRLTALARRGCAYRLLPRRIVFQESLGSAARSLPSRTAASPRECGVTASGCLAVFLALTSSLSSTRCSSTS